MPSNWSQRPDWYVEPLDVADIHDQLEDAERAMFRRYDALCAIAALIIVVVAWLTGVI